PPRQVDVAPKREKAAGEIAKVDKAAKALKMSFANLSDGARNQLGLYAPRDERFGKLATDAELRHQPKDLRLNGGIGLARLMVAFFEKVVDEIEGSAATREWPCVESPSLGAPNRHRGHTTLHKNYRDGSLLDFLKLVAAYLPVGVIPKPILSS